MSHCPRCSFHFTPEGRTGSLASLPMCLIGLCRTEVASRLCYALFVLFAMCLLFACDGRAATP